MPELEKVGATNHRGAKGWAAGTVAHAAVEPVEQPQLAVLGVGREESNQARKKE